MECSIIIVSSYDSVAHRHLYQLALPFSSRIMTAKSIESLEAGWSYLSLIQSSATFTGLGCTRHFTSEELLVTIVIIDKCLAVVRGGERSRVFYFHLGAWFSSCERRCDSEGECDD